MLQCDNLHSKILQSHNSKQRKLGLIDSPASTFEGVGYREIDMVNSNCYN